MMKRTRLLLFVFLLSACAADDGQNARCASEAPATGTIRAMPWGYYPGYGCGPIPPPVSAPFG